MKSPAPTAQPHVTASPTLTIAGVNEPVILRYFETLNEGAFQATGQLFAVDGEMQPPFEQAVVGTDAIASYLQAEAKGFSLQPREGTVKLLDSGYTEIEVAGKVQTPLFSVNVSWLFLVDSEEKLLLAKIKLLASPQDLLSLRG
ncbi:MAG: ketosteroid isomerase family protein [Tildeniella nuda ZEHNDER 1965/U140]|nr:ketosteroid isomerase family protein [Tildeniella nuda ZEHNDER 1965/U140]